MTFLAFYLGGALATGVIAVSESGFGWPAALAAVIWPYTIYRAFKR